MKTRWMVQYNLAGLQKPRKMVKRQGDYGSFVDRSGEFIDKTGENREGLDIVRRFFDSLEEATYFYDELNLYRSFIKKHI